MVGSNGTGKSTLLKIMAGELTPLEGSVRNEGDLFYVPQMFGNLDHLTVAECLTVDQKLDALQKITGGEVEERYFDLLNDDWEIEERCRQALEYWKLDSVSLYQKLEILSGGQKTRVFLAALQIHQPDIVLLDEPTNHLDLEARHLLYDWLHRPVQP